MYSQGPATKTMAVIIESGSFCSLCPLRTNFGETGTLGGGRGAKVSLVG